MSDRAAPIWLENRISSLPGISTKRLGLFKKLGVQSLQDLLWLMPRTYEDWTQLIPVGDLREDTMAAFEASVDDLPVLTRRGKMTYLRTRLTDREGSAIQAVWFNQPWVADRLRRGVFYRFRGKIEGAGRSRRVVNPEFRSLEGDGTLPELEPVYPLTAGLYQSTVRQAVRSILDDPAFFAPESLPAAIRSEARLATADFAVRRIHFPASWRDVEVARKRLAFEELFLVMAGLRALKSGRLKERGPRMVLGPETEAWLNGLKARLPFELTASQAGALSSVLNDFRKEEPANRLVQGDVGSGKTVVAALAMAAACREGYQAVLMAPTTILAGQHAETISRLLEGSGLSIGLLTGAVTAARRRRLLARLEDGSLDILVGTHAVLEGDVSFARLGFCVTDEQHRFGVRQRVSLTGQGERVPHVLVMSATPIPRTLAMILYGDLDISEIRDRPAGRLPVKTYTASEGDRARIDRMMAARIAEGNQVYVVCPQIEDSELTGLRSAESVFHRLSEEVFQDRRVALMHGRLKAGEKLAVMEAFGRGEIDILVSTTVIEVGIDQPNATLLVVENAERFGLSQLHQLRGRVGRSSHPSYCVLVSDSQDRLIRERLRVLCRNDSGFAIADEDLRLRGPGDFFGVQQHGLPDFKVANLYEDTELLRQAAAACDRIFGEDPLLGPTDQARVLEAFRTRYGDRLTRPGL